MAIIVAKSAGFCYGVNRAVKTVYEQLENTKVVTLGEIIHNKVVTSDLSIKGANVINDLDEYTGGTLIIRTHGVTEEIINNINEKNICYNDCTCPDVKRIHKIVEEKSKDGFDIIVVGNEVHPEVEGILGWCKSNTTVISDETDSKIDGLQKDIKYFVVAQTTYNSEMFENVIKKLNEKKINISYKNTICNATEVRQKEAIEISKKVNVMIVLGDKKSSNSTKLFELCKKNCKNTYFIESITDLQLKFICNSGNIGITAGASTPQAIIKEAILFMSEQLEQSFEEMLKQQEETALRPRATVTGTVIKVVGDEVFVNVNYKSDGIIPYGEFSKDPEVKPTDVVKPGDEIDVYVLTLNDGEGNVKLSRKKVEDMKSFYELEEIYENKEVVKGKVVRTVNGGLIANINTVDVFVPASQISATFVRDLKQFVDKEFDFNIIEFNKAKGKVVAGRKELAIAEENKRKEEIYAKITEGTVVEGVVRRVVDYGAFVDIGGVDGLVHISELAWNRVKKVTDIVNVNDKVEVKILEINQEKGKIALSLKAVTPNPWDLVTEKYPVGSVVEGTVVRIVDFGAFVDIEPGIDALLHISQISNEHTEKVEDVLTVGQNIKAEVIELDLANKKISISAKKLENIDAETTEEA